MLSCICRFLGLVFCVFSGNFFQNAFQTYICGLILGPCFCRNPFLWRAIDFRFLLSRFRYFLWILKFLLLLLLCFSTSLLFCVFALLFSACMLVLLFRYFVFSCFSASLLFLLLSVLLPCFFPFSSCFAAFLLLCLSISTCLFLQSCIFMIFLKDKNTQTIPIFRVTFSRI